MTSRLAIMGAMPARVGRTQRRRSITCTNGADSDVYECLFVIVMLFFLSGLCNSNSVLILSDFHYNFFVFAIFSCIFLFTCVKQLAVINISDNKSDTQKKSM